MDLINLNFLSLNRQKIFFSILSGIALTMAFPKPGYSWFAFFAFIPIFYTIKDCTEKQSAAYGLIFGLSHFFTLLFWIIYTLNTYGFLPIWLCVPILFLLAFYLSLYTAAFLWLITKLCKNQITLIIIAPTLWVCLEFIRSHALTGFPWELLGYSQFRLLPLIQMADITGVYGVSFLIILINTALFQLALLLGKKSWQNQKVSIGVVVASLLVAFCLSAVSIGYGYYKIKYIEDLALNSKKATISTIQGNIDQSVKWDKKNQIKTIEKYHELSLKALGKKPDLIVWPETAAPFYLFHNTDLTNRLLNEIEQTETPYLIGSPSFKRVNKEFVFYNTAYLINSSGEPIDKYSKVHLVPFGEYVPLQKFLPFIKKLTEQVGNFLPGEKGKTIKLNDLNLGIQICFEVVFPNLSRAATNNGANLIINMTNDAWFGRKSAPFQHFSMVVFRAVENRRAIARAANTGVSGFIEPDGRIIATTDLYIDAQISEQLPLLETITFYTRFGDIFAWGCFFIITILVIAVKWRKN